MTGPQVKSSKPPKLPTQVINEGEKIFEKEEHQLIYRTFLDTLKNPEEQTEQEIKKKEQKLKEKLSDQEKQKLQSDLESLGKQLKQLNNEDEKKIFTFILKNHESIFNNINEDIKSLSEENFCQFLLSISQKIKEKILASEENLKNGEIEKVVAECVANIRGTEAKDSSIKLLGWPFGIKIDPKNISSSFMNGVKEKIPFLGKDKKEEDEPPLSDEEMVTTFLRKSLLPIILFSLPALIFGTGPIMLGIAVVGLLITEIKVIKSLFSNNKKGTLYNPDLQDDKEKEEWDGKILDGISKILETEVEGAEESKRPAVIAGEQLTEKRPSTEFGQVSVDQLDQNAQRGPLEQLQDKQQAQSRAGGNGMNLS
jgi:hypothetical protein